MAAQSQTMGVGGIQRMSRDVSESESLASPERSKLYSEPLTSTPNAMSDEESQVGAFRRGIAGAVINTEACTCHYDAVTGHVCLACNSPSEVPSSEVSSPRHGSASVHDDLDGTSGRTSEILNTDEIRVPIIGYEIMDHRARFTRNPVLTMPCPSLALLMLVSIDPCTLISLDFQKTIQVFRLHVHKSDTDSWFVFRRYTDFVALNTKLSSLFPHFRLALPPKRYLAGNFERDFLDERMSGLQEFINNVISHKEICNSHPTREFFCFDEPPGPHDSLEESRALCEELEDQVYLLRRDLLSKTSELDLLREERNLYKSQVTALHRALRVERTLRPKQQQQKAIMNDLINSALSGVENDASLAECDRMLHSVNADEGKTSSAATAGKKNREMIANHRRSCPDLPERDGYSLPVGKGHTNNRLITNKAKGGTESSQIKNKAAVAQ